MLLETDLVPYSLSYPVGERLIVLAPHPDDETFGMGGSLRLLTEFGKKVKVVILTEGEKADPKVSNRREYSSARKKEALKAFKILGVTDYAFLGFPDRELISNMDKAEEIIFTIVSEFAPDVIYSPSVVELNPDHRVAADIAIRISQRIRGLKCIFYEITTPIRPNILIDITKTFKLKKKAMKCYRSQLKLTDYLALIQAIGKYRTFTLGQSVRFAEAFWRIDDTASKNEMRMWLSYETPYCCK